MTHKALVQYALFGSLFFLLGFLAGCGGETEAGSCTPGEVESCLCLPSGDESVRTCAADEEFGSCECDGVPDAGIPDDADSPERDADPGDPDADPGDPDTDTGEPEADTGEPSDPNECGGEEELIYDGAHASPTDVCGACEDGVLACDSPNSLRCIQTGEADDCGSCEDEADLIGGACGPCGDGAFECSDDDTVACVGASQANACGGCQTLTNSPGSECGDDGVWSCDSLDTVTCEVDLQTNICGGTAELDDAPGESCGPCDDGEIICVAPNSTACVGATNLNDCGGCGGLAGTPGDTCDDDSQWQCDGDDAVECVFLGDYNACGGTVELDYEPNTACDDCGTWTCEGDNAVICEGTTDIDTDPDNCGSCGNQCTADQFCDVGSCEPYNACGGTQELDAEPDEECGDCGVWACQGNNAVICEGEVDLQNDPDNCGSCDHSCGNEEFCESGVCSIDKIIEVDLSASLGCALRQSGEVFCWGNDLSGFFPMDVDITDATAISVGGGHVCALLQNQRVACWGGNYDGQLGHGSDEIFATSPVLVQGLTDVTAIDASPTYTCAIADGQAYCWGANGSGRLGDGTLIDRNAPVAVSSELPANVTSISTGSSHTCAIANQEAYCWGAAGSGRLGNGNTTTYFPTPQKVSNLSSAQSITAGNQHTCAITTGNLAYCWGNNFSGQLGDGSTTSRSLPVPVTNLGVVEEISIGSSASTCALRTDGRVYCWGQGRYGALGTGNEDDYSLPQWVSTLPEEEVVHLTSGDHDRCVILANGQLVCWGRNRYNLLKDNQLDGPWLSSYFPRWLPVISPLFPPVTTEYGQCFTNTDSSGNGLVDCEDPDCATDLGEATGEDVTSGQLLGFSGHYATGTCGGAGPENVYAWTAPMSGTFTFEAGGQSNTDSDVILYLRDSCIAGELACATGGGTDNRPSLEADVTAGETYYLFVDSEPSGSSIYISFPEDGIYTVHIHPPN